MFKKNSPKFNVLKVTAAAIFTSIGKIFIKIFKNLMLGQLLTISLLVSSNVAWFTFQYNLFDADTYSVLLRLFMALKHLFMPWIAIILFKEVKKIKFCTTIHKIFCRYDKKCFHASKDHLKILLKSCL